jgi:hypothetical protein
MHSYLVGLWTINTTIFIYKHIYEAGTEVLSAITESECELLEDVDMSSELLKKKTPKTC